VLISNGLATMGFSVPAAIGSALARPARPVVCMVGDGGLGMTLAELETIARLALPITVVVFNDAALSLIEIKQGDGHGGPEAVRYRLTDFAAVARGFGLPGEVVEDAAALERMLAGPWPAGPRLIDARIDPSVYPHVIQVTRG
jgi:acetolactate synthase-1/2/3 large subunit